MLPSVNDAQGWIVLLLGLAALALQLWALVDCALTRAEAFVAADKRTKPVWLLITGLAVLVGFVFYTNPFTLFNLLAVVGAGVYLSDVRPAVRAVGRGRRGAGGSPGRW